MRLQDRLHLFFQRYPKIMFKSLTFLAALVLATGCTTQPTINGTVASDCQTACQSACLPVYYEVAVDSWCGSGCDTYPVSHRAANSRPENPRVVRLGTGRLGTCATP